MEAVVAILDFQSEQFQLFFFFYLQVAPIFPTKFLGNRPFGSEVQNRFSRWPPWWPSWISDQNDFSYFWSTSCPDISYQVLSPLVCQMATYRPSWVSDWNNFSYCLPTSCPILSTKFRVNWRFMSGEEAEKRFSSWWPSWISDRNNFSYSWSASCLDNFYQVLSQLAFSFKRRRTTQIFKKAAILDFWSNDFSYFWSTSHPDSYQVLSQLAQRFSRSRLLKQIVDASRRTMDIGWQQQLTLSTVFRWAKKKPGTALFLTNISLKFYEILKKKTKTNRSTWCSCHIFRQMDEDTEGR